MGLVLVLLLIVAIVWLTVVLTRPLRFGGLGPFAYQNPAFHELDLAYAGGQLSGEEYLRRRADISWSGYSGGPSFQETPSGHWATLHSPRTDPLGAGSNQRSDPRLRARRGGCGADMA